MKRNIIETVMGGVVLAVAIGFLVFAYASADIGAGDGGYEVTARFERIDGLSPGSDVRISGVKVGSVTAIALNPTDYLAEVRISLDPSITLPADTGAVIASESLLGGRYLALEPGGDSEKIASGGAIQYTQSTPGIEQLLGQVIFSLQNLGAAGEGG